MSTWLNTLRNPEPRFILLYTPLQFLPGETAKPDGSLSLAYIAGALRGAGYHVKILDCSVGDDDDSLDETFFRTVKLESGLLRIGLSLESILEKTRDYDVIGISSIFTPQTTMALDVIRAIKKARPDSLVIAGGVNARSLKARFLANGADVIALSESEETVVNIAEALRGKRVLSEIPGISYLEDEQIVSNPMGPISSDLDALPFPAWDLLPLEKYWTLSRPHGGDFPIGQRIQYASIQTSRGCPFRCKYCHISKEEEGSLSGNIGGLRVKSIDRVMAEFQTLKDLGVEYVFIEDDSLLAKKRRAYQLFSMLDELGMKLLDVNGINLCHLYKRVDTDLEIDTELMEALRHAGFQHLALPFESASQRILDKYSSSKWSIDQVDTKQLIRAFRKTEISVSGNYMIGFPDERREEIQKTILMAKRNIEEGLDYALFFSVVPFPGTALFDQVIDNGQLSPNFDTDKMRWTKSILSGLAMSPEALEELRQLAWLMVNRPEYVAAKQKMTARESPL